MKFICFTILAFLAQAQAYAQRAPEVHSKCLLAGKVMDCTSHITLPQCQYLPDIAKMTCQDYKFSDVLFDPDGKLADSNGCGTDATGSFIYYRCFNR